MTTYKPVHAVCLFLCEFQIMDTRHIMLNDWNLLLEERHSAVVTTGMDANYQCLFITGAAGGIKI